MDTEESPRAATVVTWRTEVALEIGVDRQTGTKGIDIGIILLGVVNVFF